MDGEPAVQPTEPVSKVEPVSPEGVTTPTVAAPQALTEERVQEMIAEATAKAVAAAKELGRRELQSQQDRNRAEVEVAVRRAKLAEDTSKTARQRIQELDPDAAKDLELSELRAREVNRVAVEQETAQRQQQEIQGKALQDSLHAHLEALGIDPKDKRIDWAADISDYVQGRNRFDASLVKIIKEERQTMQNSLEKRLKDLEAKVSKVSTEANSVDTTISPGVVAGSDAEFLKKFGAGELELNKANVERYRKLVSSY